MSMIIKETVVERLMHELRKKYVGKSDNDLKIAINGFIEYVMLIKETGEDVPMYSESVDFVWHTFILDTREYASFCDEQFGYFLHHVPNSSSSKKESFFTNVKENEELKLLFMKFCKLRGINPFTVYNTSDAPYIFQADYILGLINYQQVSQLVLAINNDKADNDFEKMNRRWWKPKKALKNNLYDRQVDSYYNSQTNSYGHSKDILTDIVLPSVLGIGAGVLAAEVVEDIIDNERDNYRNETVVEDDDTSYVSPVPSCASSPLYYTSPSCSSSSTSDSSSPSSCSSSSCSSSSCSSSSCSSSSSSCSGGF